MPSENISLPIKIKRELFSFTSEQDWVNRARRLYATCGVQKGMYITVDAKGHVVHMGKCFMAATKSGSYPITCYELQNNWQS